MGDWNRLRKHSHDSEGHLFPSNTRKTFQHKDHCSEMEKRQGGRLAVEATQSLAPKTNSRIRNLTTLTENTTRMYSLLWACAYTLQMIISTQVNFAGNSVKTLNIDVIP